MGALWNYWHTWIWSAGVLTAAILAGLIAHRILFFILGRLARRKGSYFISSIFHHGKAPSRWVFPLLALLPALPASGLPEKALDPLEHAAGIGLVATIAWLVVLCVDVASDILTAREAVSVEDRLAARRLKTTTQVLRHIVVSLVVIVSLAVMLMTFPAVKHIGMSLLASAGLAGLVVGMAMKSTLSSLIAGIQIAFSQPIRIEDSVVVEGEWGWVEEIGTTQVVVRTWDLRRLVLPLSYFIEHPFQNWTRGSTELLGSVLLWVDYSVPVTELREELGRILKSTDKWKGQVSVLQVTDVNERAMQVRALMDARDADSTWDLRCHVREKLIQFLLEKYPDALPKVRTEFQDRPGEKATAALSARRAAM
jgi:small-conductance mechanosensitive channel